MKCQTCQQNKTATINGRMFCENCGKKAAERLRQFNHTQQPKPQSLPTSDNKSHVLDLSSHNPTAKIQAPSNPAINNRIYMGGDITSPGQQHHSEQTGIDNDTTVNYTPNYVSGESTQQVDQPTPMEPHQTYTLKSDSNRQGEAPRTFETGPETDNLTPTTDLSAVMNQSRKDSSKKKSKNSMFSRLKQGKLAHIGALGLSMVLMTGYVTYLNYPDIAVRVAANNAEINAQLPDYTPNGYSFQGPVAYGPGELVVSFGSDDGLIDIAQSRTEWDSESLLENYIRQQTAQYDTYREGGLTIYTYGNGNAAWVNGGMLYRIDSESPLRQEEVVRMAGSI